MEYYTYFHTRNDTGAVFYVGKGKGKRAWVMQRGVHWMRVVAKAGHTVHIAARWPTESEAYEHEKLLIACFKDMKLALCNRTEGGPGVCGAEVSPAHRAAVSAAAKRQMKDPKFKARMIAVHKGRKASEETKAKISAATKGRKKSEETKAKISDAMRRRATDPGFKTKLSAATKISNGAAHRRLQSKAKAEEEWRNPERKVAAKKRAKELWADPIWSAQRRAELVARNKTLK